MIQEVEGLQTKITKIHSIPPLVKGVRGILKGKVVLDIRTLKQKGVITTGYHLPYNPKLKERARELRKNMTNAEKKLWCNYLKKIKYPVLRQKPIDNYIVDFYCPHLRLVIEIDGDSHFTEEGKIYDDKRKEILESYGLKIIRITNNNVLRNINEVCQKIESEIPMSPFIKGG